MDYVKIGIKMGLSRRRAEELKSTIKEAIDVELKENLKVEKKSKSKPVMESKDITEPKNTYV